MFGGDVHQRRFLIRLFRFNVDTQTVNSISCKQEMLDVVREVFRSLGDDQESLDHYWIKFIDVRGQREALVNCATRQSRSLWRAKVAQVAGKDGLRYVALQKGDAATRWVSLHARVGDNTDELDDIAEYVVMNYLGRSNLGGQKARVYPDGVSSIRVWAPVFYFERVLKGRKRIHIDVWDHEVTVANMIFGNNNVETLQEYPMASKEGQDFKKPRSHKPKNSETLNIELSIVYEYYDLISDFNLEEVIASAFERIGVDGDYVIESAFITDDRQKAVNLRTTEDVRRSVFKRGRVESETLMSLPWTMGRIWVYAGQIKANAQTSAVQWADVVKEPDVARGFARPLITGHFPYILDRVLPPLSASSLMRSIKLNVNVLAKEFVGASKANSRLFAAKSCREKWLNNTWKLQTSADDLRQFEATSPERVMDVIVTPESQAVIFALQGKGPIDVWTEGNKVTLKELDSENYKIYADEKLFYVIAHGPRRQQLEIVLAIYNPEKPAQDFVESREAAYVSIPLMETRNGRQNVVNAYLLSQRRASYSPSGVDSVAKLFKYDISKAPYIRKSVYKLEQTCAETMSCEYNVSGDYLIQLNCIDSTVVKVHSLSKGTLLWQTNKAIDVWPLAPLALVEEVDGWGYNGVIFNYGLVNLESGKKKILPEFRYLCNCSDFAIHERIVSFSAMSRFNKYQAAKSYCLLDPKTETLRICGEDTGFTKDGKSEVVELSEAGVVLVVTNSRINVFDLENALSFARTIDCSDFSSAIFVSRFVNGDIFYADASKHVFRMAAFKEEPLALERRSTDEEEEPPKKKLIL